MSFLRFLLGLFTSFIALIALIPFFILGLPFMLLAGLTRGIARVIEPAVVPWQDVITYDSTLGWRPKPNLAVHCLADDVFRLTTDAHGWRGGNRIDESAIVVVGDSFAFGYGVNDCDFFGGIDSGMPVKAIGAPGYNMVQELLLMRQYASALKGQLVVWFVFIGNDLYENLQPNMMNYRAPFVRRANGSEQWQIATNHLSPMKWPYNFERHEAIYHEALADICTPNSYLGTRAFSACAYLIQQGRDLCAQSDSHMAVLIIPDPAQLSPVGTHYIRSFAVDSNKLDVSLPDRRLTEICSALGVPSIAASQYLSIADYNRFDKHWNPQGHQRVSQLVRDLAQRSAR